MCEECGCPDIPQEDSELHHHDHAPVHDRGQEEPEGGMRHVHIDLNVPVMARNDHYARENRCFFERAGLFVINLMSSPGSGKTTLVEAMARRFGDRMAVIEGDIQTHRDAERVIRAGSRARQIETRGACHLDAHTVGHVLQDFDLQGVRLLVIENVGNAVCPAGYDLGEKEKVAILSLPEGDDKILKYPALFSRVHVLLINKIDLAPYLQFDVRKALNECRSLNRAAAAFCVSATTGEGMDLFFDYLAQRAGIDN